MALALGSHLHLPRSSRRRHHYCASELRYRSVAYQVRWRRGRLGSRTFSRRRRKLLGLFWRGSPHPWSATAVLLLTRWSWRSAAPSEFHATHLPTTLLPAATTCSGPISLSGPPSSPPAHPEVRWHKALPDGLASKLTTSQRLLCNFLRFICGRILQLLNSLYCILAVFQELIQTYCRSVPQTPIKAEQPPED